MSSRSGYQIVSQDPVGWGGQWGGYTDQETGGQPGNGFSPPGKRSPLVLLGHRYYDPGAGRFLNRDPVGMEGGVNVYAYCTNNPINLCDPFGLWELSIGGFTFDGEVVSEGLKTGLAAVGHVFSGGAYDGGRFRNKAGFGTSVGLAKTGNTILTVTGIAGLAKGVITRVTVKLAVRGALAANAGITAATATSAAIGATEEAAPLTGWIAKSLYSRLAAKPGGGELLRALENALKNGLVGPQGEQGIKAVGRTGLYELKILGQGGKVRLVGKIETVALRTKGGEKVIKTVVFRDLLKDH